MIKRHLHLFIAVAIFAVLKIILPLDTGLTPMGATALAMFVALIYSWITINISWVSFLSIGLLVLSGVASHTQIWALSWGSFIAVLCLCVTLLNEPVKESGIPQKIATWFITRNVVKGRPYVFFTLFLLSNFFVSCFMDGIPCAIIFALMAKSINEELGYTSADKFAKVLMLSTLWMTSLGYGATPIGHPVVLTLMGIVQNNTGETISFLNYMMVGVPAGLMILFGTALIIKFILRPDCSKFSEFNVERRKAEMTPLTTEGKIVGIVYLLVIVGWLFPDLFAGMLPGAAAYIKGLGAAIPPLLGVGILCIMTHKGKPLMDIIVAARNMPWVVIIFIASTMAFSATMSMESTGIQVFLKNTLLPLTANMPPFLFVVIAILFTLTLTNFTSNAVTGIITLTAFFPVIVSMASAVSGTPLAFGVVIILCAEMAMLTPPSSAYSTFCFTSGYVTAIDGIKIGWPVVLLTMLVTLLFSWPMAGMLF